MPGKGSGAGLPDDKAENLGLLFIFSFRARQERMRDMLATDGETTQRRSGRGRLTSGGRHQPALMSVAFVRANAIAMLCCC